MVPLRIIIWNFRKKVKTFENLQIALKVFNLCYGFLCLAVISLIKINTIWYKEKYC